MDLHEVSKSLQALWENKPGAVVLLIIGFGVFLVVDAWRHKRRRKRSRIKWRP